MKKSLWLVVLWLLLMLPALAQDVQIGDQLLFRVDTPQQAEAISQRIEKQMLEGAKESDLRLATVKTGVAIYWGKLEIVVITKALAAANNSEPKALAQQWLSRLREVAAQGMIKLTPARLELPIGGEASIEVSGLATGPFFFQESTGHVQLFEESPTRLRVVAKQVGKTRLLVQRGKAKAQLFVHVKDWAGKVPDSVQIQVTGDPAPGKMVTEGLLRSLQSRSTVNPGCRLEIDFPSSYAEGVPSIPQGQAMTVSVIARISGGEDYYPVRKDVRASIESIKLEAVEPNLLLVSNRPEQVNDDGVLLQYTFTAKEPSRLMYSHMNASQEARNLWVNLTNTSDKPVKLLVNWTFAGPNRSEVQVGHQAALRFLERLGTAAGYVLEVPPMTRLELAEHRVSRRELLSGFASLRILEGDKLEVEVLSKLTPGRNDGSKLVHLGAPFNPFKIHPHGVFAQPYFEEWLDYAVGQKPLNFNFGESPWLIDFETGLPNTGNFGVIYNWHVALSNPTQRPSKIGLYFTPRNGAAALSLLLNKQLVSIPFTRRQQEVPVRSFDLAPQQELNLDLTTLPEASSSYPSTLEFREIAPGDAVPPGFHDQR